MISAYVRELRRYTYTDLKNIFKCDNHSLNRYIRKLKEYSILKVVPFTQEQKDLTDLNNNDIEIAPVEENDSNHYYVFDYVGVITVDGVVLKIYPKYIKSTNEPKEQMKQVLKVIEKFNNQEQIIKIFNDSDYSKSFNSLAVCLYFLNDYFENGVYNNELNILEENGTGEIYWDKTINDAFTLISNGRPYYTTLYTKKRKNNDQDFFKELHETIITKCSDELKDADILDLFDLTEVFLTDQSIDEFGDIDYILYRLENEMNVQFNTRKNNLLKMMYAYISNKGTLEELDNLSMFGTKSFNLVWEKVCAKVLNNHLDTYLCDLPLKNNTYKIKDGKLIDIIEKPKWIGHDDQGVFIHEAATLIPDTIVVSEDSMTIYDAKYYCFEHTRNSLKGQPGIESITKQYLYQVAYNEFCKMNNIEKISNCFLFPIEDEKTIIFGDVKLEFMDKFYMPNIETIGIPAMIVYENYLQNKAEVLKLGKDE